VNGETLQRLAKSCDEFLVHGVDVEGLRLGVDEELVDILGRGAPVPITYAGGVQTMVRLSLPRLTQLAACLQLSNEFGSTSTCATCPSTSPSLGHGLYSCLQDDLELVRQVGNGNVNVTVGSALDIFGGDLPYSGVVSWHRRQQQA
jgi:phosphoribosylformimino-5-aminoimidazole carboxamide ribotide isomerase